MFDYNFEEEQNKSYFSFCIQILFKEKSIEEIETSEKNNYNWRISSILNHKNDSESDFVWYSEFGDSLRNFAYICIITAVLHRIIFTSPYIVNRVPNSNTTQRIQHFKSIRHFSSSNSCIVNVLVDLSLFLFTVNGLQ